jgi:lysophospholipase L1-like esterase
MIALKNIAHKKASAFGALGLAATRRVDMVMIGDSNQLLNGFGFDHGFGKALTERFGTYASPLFCPADSAAAGYLSNNQGAIGVGTGAPSELDAFWPSTDSKNYGYLSTGTFSGNNGTAITNGNCLNVNSNLRWHFAYGTFNSGAGSFKVGIRRGTSPFNTLVNGVLTNTNTGSYSIVQTYLDLAAGTRDYPLEFKYYNNGGTVITAPFIAFHSRIEDLNKTNGVSVHTLYGAGGQSLYDMAYSMITTNTTTKLIAYFTQIRRLQISQGLSPKVVIYINSGANDRNETSQPSLGPNPSSVPDSSAAYVDNLQAIINRIEGVWTTAGWDVHELYFLIMPTHPISSPDDAELISYRLAAKYFALRARTSFVDLTTLTTFAEMSANSWYDATDKIHLTQAGYENLSARVVNLIQ